MPSRPRRSRTEGPTGSSTRRKSRASCGRSISAAMRSRMGERRCTTSKRRCAATVGRSFGAKYEFVKVTASALEKAGWTIERTAAGSDGVVWAHYARNGRDLWLYERAQGDSQSIEVVDVGAEASAARLKEELAKSGHAALY